MKEILTNTLQDIYFDVFKNGVLVDADANPTVSIYRDNVALVSNANTVKITGQTGKYSYTLPTTVIDSESNLVVQWSFSVNSVALTIPENYQVVTPYSTWDYFHNEDANIIYSDYLESERVARLVINSYCGQQFGYKATTFAVEGAGTETLTLPWRLIVLDSVDWTEAWEWDVRPGSIIGLDAGTSWELAADGWFLRLQPIVIAQNVVVNHTPTFKRNILYNVKGTWGYAGVPTEIEEASKILTANYLCKDHTYRDRYIKQLKMGDWSIGFHDFAFNGTGDQTVDSLLKDYRNHPGVGLI